MADGNVVANGRARRRSLPAKRGGFADERHSHGRWLDDQTFCDGHTEGNADVHAGSDTKSRRSAPRQPLISGCALRLPSRSQGFFAGSVFQKLPDVSGIPVPGPLKSGLCRRGTYISPQDFIRGRDHENWQFSKRTDGAKNGFKTFDAPIVANQEQHEICFLNLAPQASDGTRCEARGRQKLSHVDTVGDGARVLPVKIVIQEGGRAL